MNREHGTQIAFSATIIITTYEITTIFLLSQIRNSERWGDLLKVPHRKCRTRIWTWSLWLSKYTLVLAHKEHHSLYSSFCYISQVAGSGSHVSLPLRSMFVILLGFLSTHSIIPIYSFCFWAWKDALSHLWSDLYPFSLTALGLGASRLMVSWGSYLEDHEVHQLWICVSEWIETLPRGHKMQGSVSRERICGRGMQRKRVSERACLSFSGWNIAQVTLKSKHGEKMDKVYSRACNCCSEKEGWIEESLLALNFHVINHQCVYYFYWEYPLCPHVLCRGRFVRAFIS